MYNNKNIVAITPAGRQDTLSILYQYLSREHSKGLLDTWKLWKNTKNQSDLDYCDMLARENSWIRTEECSIPIDPGFVGKSIHSFFKRCCDTDNIYVRFDDDIVYLHEDMLLNLLKFRITNPQYFLVYGNIVNNSICSHIHQRFGLLPALEAHKFVGYECMDGIGWGSPSFSEHTHRCFLKNLADGKVNEYMFPRWECYRCERVSINCFCFFGSDMAKIGGDIHWDEEPYLACELPAKFQTCNCICGTALVSHYAFYTQRNHLNETDVLEKYRALSTTPAL